MLGKVGFTPERIAEINQHALSVEILEMAAYAPATYFSASSKELPRPQRLARSAATRSSDSPNRQKVYELMGIDDLADQVVANTEQKYDKALDPLIDLFLAGTPESIATMRDYLIYTRSRFRSNLIWTPTRTSTRRSPRGIITSPPRRRCSCVSTTPSPPTS